MNRVPFLVLLVASISLAQTRPARLPADKIENAIGAKGAWNDGGSVFKIMVPRSDVKVTVEGVALPPYMGLSSWVGFQAGKRKPSVLAGDLVLFADEVNPAMSAALENGLSVTALHNHFMNENPRVFFMHIGAEADPVLLAVAVRKTLDAVKDIRAKSPVPVESSRAMSIAKRNITSAPLEAILNMKGQSSDGMFKVVIGQEVEMPCGCVIGKDMGVNTWAAFMGSDDQALVDGDFACVVGQLQPVLKSLRASNINIVAIHNHMEFEAPRTIFLHYWGVGKAEDLARAIKAALDAKAKAAEGS